MKLMAVMSPSIKPGVSVKNSCKQCKENYFSSEGKKYTNYLKKKNKETAFQEDGKH